MPDCEVETFKLLCLVLDILDIRQRVHLSKSREWVKPLVVFHCTPTKKEEQKGPFLLEGPWTLAQSDHMVDLTMGEKQTISQTKNVQVIVRRKEMQIIIKKNTISLFL